MVLYDYECTGCRLQWSAVRDIDEGPPARAICPKCHAEGRRLYRHLKNMDFKAYDTDELTGHWEHIDSKHTELRRERETGKARYK